MSDGSAARAGSAEVAARAARAGSAGGTELAARAGSAEGAGSAGLAAAGEALEVLGALADPHRRAILVRLAQGALCTCTDLVEATGVAQPTVSHHLKVLREAGLVTGERCGRFVNYAAVPARLRALEAAFRALADAAGSAATS